MMAGLAPRFGKRRDYAIEDIHASLDALDAGARQVRWYTATQVQPSSAHTDTEPEPLKAEPAAEESFGKRSGILGDALMARAETSMPGINGIDQFAADQHGAPNRQTHSVHATAECLCQMAEIGPADVLLDLGCGAGQLLVAACQRAGCKGIGIELDASLCAEATALVERLQLSDRIEIRQQDVFEAPLYEATVIYLYLLPAMNKQLSASLDLALRRKTRVVSNVFKLYSPMPMYPQRERVSDVPRPYGELILYQRPRKIPAVKSNSLKASAAEASGAELEAS